MTRISEVVLPSGLRLEYAEKGEGPQNLLFIHGYGDSWYSFNGMIEALPAGYRALAVSLRGHGSSDKPAAGYSIAQHARDVLEFIALKNCARPIVVGHSMGSFIAQELALLAPEVPSRLVLIASATTADNAVLAGVYAETLRLSDPVPRAFAHDFQSGTCVNPLGPNMTLGRVVEESAKLPAHVWQQALKGLIAYRSGQHVDSGLAAIAVPTLILWGIHDGIFSSEEQTKLAAAIPGATLSINDVSGHALNWEFPVETLDVILGFTG